MKRDQKGFAVLETILILVVVAIIGGAGYYVWHTRQLANDAYSKTTPALTHSASANSTSKKSDKDFLVIKEWGVKLPLNPNIEDAYYRYDSRDNGYVYLSLLSLKNIDDCAVDKTAIGAITRYDSDDVNPISGEKYTAEYRDTEPVGRYYFLYGTAQATCSESQEALDKIGLANQAFGEAVSSLKLE
jgi:hypothetical protein